MSRYRTNDGEWRQPKRDIGVDSLPLFAGETGITPPKPALETGDAKRDRVIDTMAVKRADWIDRIHTALVAQLVRMDYDGIVDANSARAVYLSFPDADPSVDLRFLAALWKRPGWIFVDYNGVTNAPGNHAGRRARYRYDPSAAERQGAA